MHVELVRTTTRDGLRLDGALTPTRSVSEGPRPAAILLHGAASNFYTSSTFEPLIPKLNELGFAVLSINTRGHDSVFNASLGNVRCRLGSAYETVDDCRLDISAWIDFLSARGHEKIVLIGHSLGAVKSLYAQAHEKFPNVAAVIAISPPRLSYSAFMNAPESSLFWESMQTAEAMAKSGKLDELFMSKYPFPTLMTPTAFIDKYGPAERYNLLKFADQLPCPSLFTYGSKELVTGNIPFDGVPEILNSLPNADQRTIAVIEDADHVYTGVAPELAGKITHWLLSRDQTWSR